MAELSPADQLDAKYDHSIDFGDGDGWAATFTADGTFGSGRGEPTVGTEALATFASGFPDVVKGRHWNSNLLVEPSDSGASGKVYLMLMNLAAEGGPGANGHGRLS